MPDKALLDLYAAILKFKAEHEQSFEAEEFATNLMNQSPYYTMLEPYCKICGMKANHKNSELHHIAGRKHSYRTITVCEDCHRVLSEKQKVWDARWCYSDLPEGLREAFLLQGLSDILRLRTRKTGNPGYEILADLLTEAISKRSRGCIWTLP